LGVLIGYTLFIDWYITVALMSDCGIRFYV
jgi:hypothetical protein